MRSNEGKSRVQSAQVRLADYDDLDAIIHLCSEYFSESVYAGSTLNADCLRGVVLDAINPTTPAWIILAENDGILAGMAYFYVTRDMVVEGVAEVSMFYVRKDYRNGTVSRKLRDEIERTLADEGKCRYCLVACSSGSGAANDRAFRMLWKGAGYSVLGTELVRETR